jgi:hypothetical protein
MKLRRAVKYRSWVKLALAGLAGAGKSVTALETAGYLSTKGIAVIDADYPGAVSKYAKEPGEEGFGFSFEVLEIMLEERKNARTEQMEEVEIEKPFRPARFLEAIRLIYESGRFDVLVIDGMSSEWDGKGGMLEWVDELTKKFKHQNVKDATRKAWAIATPEHRKLFQYLLSIRMHVIITLRAKKETVTFTDESGIKSHKIALEPIQREEIPYLFDVLAYFEEKRCRIDTSHCPTLPEGLIISREGPFLAQTLNEWLRGKLAPDRPVYDPDPAIGDLYTSGLEVGLWTAETFYERVATILEMETLTRETARLLTGEHLRRLKTALDDQEIFRAPAQEELAESYT